MRLRLAPLVIGVAIAQLIRVVGLRVRPRDRFVMVGVFIVSGFAVMTKERMMEKHYFECICGHSVLSVTRDEWDEHTSYVSLLIYGEHTAGWKDRLRHIWSIVKYGHPWQSTELLLQRPEAKRLGKLLIGKEE